MLSRVAFIVALLLAVPAWAGDVQITIGNVQSDGGSVMIGLYDTPEGFRAAIKHSTDVGLLNDHSRVAGMALRAVAGPQTVILAGLKPGRYAIIAFHDEDDDGKLGATPWGVPTEGYGFSNNAWGILRAPSFDAAGFDVELTGTATQTISLTYPQKPAQNLSIPQKPTQNSSIDSSQD
jgi:uncharacterized protein (DUF2141 family)